MNISEAMIRQARQSDALELYRLNNLHNGEGCNSLDSIKESLKTNDQEIVCVAAYGENLIGFCCGQICKSLCYPVIYAEVTELFVIDEFRRQGIGKQLLNLMETMLTKRGVRHFHILTLEDNSAAKAMYISSGYAETSEILLDKG